jgi:hypothetical protein
MIARSREYKREWARRWRAAHPDLVKANREKYRLKHRANTRRWNERNRKRVTAYNRAWRAKNREHVSRYAQRWLKEHPERLAAKIALQAALRRGVLVRPKRCQSCGIGGRIEVHHEDHTKPLEVVWLCRKCHAATRRKYDTH